MATLDVRDADPTVIALLKYALVEYAGAECTARGVVEATEVIARAALEDMQRAAKLENRVRHGLTKSKQNMMQEMLKLAAQAQTHMQEAAAAEQAVEETKKAVEEAKKTAEEAKKARQEAEGQAAASVQTAASVTAEMDRVAHREPHTQEVMPTVRDGPTNGIAPTARRFTGPRPNVEQAPGGEKKHRTEGPNRQTD
jgi:hypothetical protein